MRGEGWGEGLSRRMLMDNVCGDSPSPGLHRTMLRIAEAIRPLPASGERLKLKHLPGLQYDKLLARNVGFIERGTERGKRRIDGLVGQLKCAVVMGECRL